MCAVRVLVSFRIPVTIALAQEPAVTTVSIMRSSFVAALLAASWSWETHAKIVVHETAPYPLPSGWKYTGPAAESQPLSLAVALKQPGLQELRARLDEISNPSHQDYGLHVSRDVLSRYQAVPQAAVQKVVSWLGDNAISEVTVDETWIHFNATVGQVESLMRCEVSRYLRDGSSAAVYRAKQYSLPEELLDSIDYVSPLTQFWISNQSKRSVISNPIERRSRSKLHLPRAGMQMLQEPPLPPSSLPPTVPRVQANPFCTIHSYAGKLRDR